MAYHIVVVCLFCLFTGVIYVSMDSEKKFGGSL